MSDQAKPDEAEPKHIEMWADSNYIDSILHMDSPMVSLLVIIHKPDDGPWCVTADMTLHAPDGIAPDKSSCTTAEISAKPGVPEELTRIAARHHAASALAKSRILVMAAGLPSEMHIVEVGTRGVEAFKVLCSQPWASVRCEGPDGSVDMSAESEAKARESLGLPPKPTIPVVEADEDSGDWIPSGRGGMQN